ncbi:MAG: Asp23/Gls24 family envelope stress response protein [Candidatus Omnitrophica bacterium]|nr:Asp23/Gls24 family envelope stress response protein [Candidatus Omnitrophota bacterium]MBU1871677.1 Asp23/Gls24 family envelope stress response protein [Candidatus Omnitrophota bacterium]
MKNEESRTDFGAIKIHKDVIASVASLASLEIEGVKKIGGDLKTRICEFLGKKTQRGITVEIDRNDEVMVSVPLIVKYGYNVTDVARNVQEGIQQSLEKMTNLTIKEINVNVQKIEKE